MTHACSVPSRIYAILRLCCTFSEFINWVPISRLRGTSAQSQYHTISVACAVKPRSSFEFSSCIKVRNIRKELLQFRQHHQGWACTQASRTRDFWEVHQLGETPFPSVLVWAQRDPRPVECPNSRLYQLRELSTLFP